MDGSVFTKSTSLVSLVSHPGMRRILQIRDYDGKLWFFWKKNLLFNKKEILYSFEYKTFSRIVMFWIEFNLWQTHFRGDCSLHQLYQNCLIVYANKESPEDWSRDWAKMFISKWNVCSLSGTRCRQSLHINPFKSKGMMPWSIAQWN